MKSIIQTSVDVDLRKNAEHLLSSMGLSLNDGIRMFLNQLVMNRAIPFQPRVINDSNEYIHKIKKAYDDVVNGKGGMSFNSAEEATKFIHENFYDEDEEL